MDQDPDKLYRMMGYILFGISIVFVLIFLNFVGTVGDDTATMFKPLF